MYLTLVENKDDYNYFINYTKSGMIQSLYNNKRTINNIPLYFSDTIWNLLDTEIKGKIERILWSLKDRLPLELIFEIIQDYYSYYVYKNKINKCYRIRHSELFNDKMLHFNMSDYKPATRMLFNINDGFVLLTKLQFNYKKGTTLYLILTLAVHYLRKDYEYEKEEEDNPEYYINHITLLHTTNKNVAYNEVWKDLTWHIHLPNLSTEKLNMLKEEAEYIMNSKETFISQGSGVENTYYNFFYTIKI